MSVPRPATNFSSAAIARSFAAIASPHCPTSTSMWLAMCGRWPQSVARSRSASAAGSAARGSGDISMRCTYMCSMPGCPAWASRPRSSTALASSAIGRALPSSRQRSHGRRFISASAKMHATSASSGCSPYTALIAAAKLASSTSSSPKRCRMASVSERSSGPSAHARAFSQCAMAEATDDDGTMWLL